MKNEMVKFEPGNIDLVITGTVKTNTLPEVKGSWTAWLNGFNVATLETDDDFAYAADFVAECKRVETRIDDIRENAIKGAVFKVIKELEDMRETTRQKRLEINKAVETRKEKCKTDAINRATVSLQTQLNEIKNKPTVDIELSFRTAIKGKSSLSKMQEALEVASTEILAQATVYNGQFGALRERVAQLYAEANEPATDSELNLLVKMHYESAPEQAKLILGQKQVARDKAEIEKNKAINAAPQPASTPVPAPAQKPATANMPVKALRFGVTFTTDSPHIITDKLVAMGGRQIKFLEVENV